jgi:eukaryotic-like serine/threonine-protein kinase
MTPHPNLSPGKELGQYELLLPIAQGGMATVWAARRKGLRGFQKTVAVKTMLPSLSDDPQFETMFLEEARLASGIHHPNVAEILDLGEQDDILYIVMEWVDGEALSVLSRAAAKGNMPFPQRIALRVAGQACLGLHAAHELRDPLNDDQLLGLVHRDVSPQNILVTYDGHVKLVDFGVAKATNRASGETTAGQLKGKVPYMSPEQARGGQVDRRTDIFAMGIVLYKLTTGAHPFAGENDLVTMRNIISRPALPPRLKKPDLPADLEQVLMKCLHKDADKRYQTMLELERAVQAVLAKDPPVTDDDISMFARTVMGERSQRRRTALRDAVRMIDERTSSPPPDAVLVRDSVSEFFFPQLPASAQRDGIPAPRPSAPSVTLDLLPKSAFQSSSIQGSPGAIEVPASRRRSNIVVAAVAIALTAAVGAGLVLHGRRGPERAPIDLTAAPAATAGAAAAGAAAEPTHVAVAPAITADAAPALNINDLPGVGESEPKPEHQATSSAPSATPAAAQSAPAARKAVPVKPSSTQWVPTVTNPGF